MIENSAGGPVMENSVEGPLIENSVGDSVGGPLMKIMLEVQ